METLVSTSFDLELTPGLATAWRQIEPTIWEFDIRSGVKFQNGEDLNAAAVANALNQLLGAEVPARSFRPDQIKSIDAPSASVLRIATNTEDAMFPFSVATPFTGILAPSAYGENGAIDITGTCTGPYEIVEVDGLSSLRMKRNEGYWGQKPAIEEVNLLFIPDANVRATMVRSGQVDLAKELPLTALAQLQATSGITTVTTPLLRTTALIFNNAKAPLSNPAVREAISLVVDPVIISEAVFDGMYPPAVGPIAPTTPWASPGAQPKAMDLDKARDLLADAGIQPGSLSLEVIAINERPHFRDVAAILQQQLQEIGIDLTIRTSDWAALESEVLAGRFDMMLMSRGYVFEFADPLGYFRFDFTCDGSFNVAQHCDPNFDTIVEQAAATADTEQRVQLYHKLADDLVERTVHSFLVHEATVDAYRSDLVNYQVDQLQLRYLNPDMKYE
ncbi:ABC transporter substrate-binding protein [Devosia sp.]|uniref:ABC transporter substrate-binding protein n=1 Tax=Devosia sp. TaxID=1871048 RepID=UPI00292F3841|nr:ABC transporter substrate-binding protein [Devosia sp.]